MTSQGSQLAVEALELALESFAQPCFAYHVSAISFGMVRAWIETILHVFQPFFVGLDAWSVCKVTQACLLSPEPQRDA